MNDSDTKILLDIKDKLTEVNTTLQMIRAGLETDRSNMWKILALTICGAFALIGVKLVFP